MKNTTFIGNVGEDLAVEYLRREGYNILERNAVICGCEVDIICEAYLLPDGSVKRDKCGRLAELIFKLFKKPLSHKGAKRTVIFCEVKTRRGSEFGSGAEAVTPYKIGRYITAAKAYMSNYKNVNCDARFDVIEVGEDGLNHIVGAFNENDARYARHGN